MSQGFQTVVLLVLSNVFMTIAWYWHLKYKHLPVFWVILISWGIAFFEYCLQVPANRIGHLSFSAPQLKVLQEGIAFSVFAVFSWWYLKEKPTLYDHIAFLTILVGVMISVFQPKVP